jgi:transposase-like protein
MPARISPYPAASEQCDFLSAKRSSHIKRRVRPMLGFKSPTSAAIILSGIEMVHMMRKRQTTYAFNPNPSLFEILAA